MNHIERVKKLAERIKADAASDENVLYSNGGRCNISQKLFLENARISNRNTDISGFNHIISLSKEELLCSCESNATFEDLVKETLRFSMIPAVVPSLKSLTVGGALCGFGVGPSSLSEGSFYSSVISYNYINSKGEYHRCVNDGSQPNSLGVIVVLVTFKLVEATGYVNMHLKNVTRDSITDELERASDEDGAFVDILNFNGEWFFCRASFMFGNEFHERDNAHRRIFNIESRTNAVDKYDSGHSFIAQFPNFLEKKAMVLTTEDYLFKFDRGCFWYFWNSGVGKYTLSDASGYASMSYLYRLPSIFRGTSPFTPLNTILFLPSIGKVDAFIQWISEEATLITPIWIQPLSPATLRKQDATSPERDTWFAVGLFSMGNSVKHDIREVICSKVLDMGGFFDFSSLHPKMLLDFDEQMFQTFFERANSVLRDTPDTNYGVYMHMLNNIMIEYEKSAHKLSFDVGFMGFMVFTVIILVISMFLLQIYYI